MTPLEGFVLSRIDGSASIGELADLTSLDEAQVHHIVRKLIALEVAEWARESVSLPKATGRTMPKTPSRPFEVPASLREEPVARIRPRPRRDSDELSEGRYSARPPPVDRVDTDRPAARPSSPPRASHTGKMFPDGEVDDDTGAGSVMPPAQAELAQAASALLEEVERMTASGNHALPLDEVDDPIDDETLDAAIAGYGEAGASPVPDAGESDSTASTAESGSEPAPPEPSPESAAPESAAPDSAAPDPSAPDSAAPDSSAPDSSAADSSAPDSSAPDSAAPDSAAPDSAAPDSAAPDSASAPPPDGDSEAEPQTDAASDEEEQDGADLAPERRQRIAELYLAIELMDHYEVLSVPRGAPRKEIRTAYFALSKLFHPDTMFRKRLGTYKAKMEAIFHRLTEAYDVLGKKRARADYDRYLGLLDRTRSVEQVVEPDGLDPSATSSDADEPSDRVPSDPPEYVPSEPPEPASAAVVEAPAQESPDPGPVAQPRPHTPAAPPPEKTRSSPAAVERRKQLMADKLRRAARASSAVSFRTVPPAGRPPSEPSEPSEAAAADRRGSALESLTRGLRQSAMQTGGPDPIRRHLAAARRHEDAENLEEALISLRQAAAVDPTRRDVTDELKRVGTRLAASLADTYEAQARYEQEHGKWSAAAISWARVFEGRPSDADAARNAADAIVSAKGDLRKARTLAQAAQDLAPSDLAVLRTLARVYIAAGLETSARGVLERAQQIDPDDAGVSALFERVTNG